MCSRVARCLRQEAQVAVRSMGSSRALIWCRVSDIVFFVCSILDCVSRSSPSKRLRIDWFSLTRSCMRFSLLAAASTATCSQRCAQRALSSRMALAASSFAAAARFRRSASCCRTTSFLLLSWRATWCRRAFSALGERPERAEEGGGVRSTTACMLRSADRRHISSTLSACIFWSMSCLTSWRTSLSSPIIALVRRIASVRRR
mmetsp:Transcript_1731/g.4347  ORF Transcript_1731/g.4347 Transcript_1731/m.4347 type:complete len:203 (-) Transcript_1731:452-1060(-)